MTGMTPVVERLQETLRGPRRVREDMLAEIRDGLEDAAEAYRASGLPPEDARRRAEADFGDPAPVAEELQVELAARYGLRSALAMAVVIPAMTVMWDLIWVAEPPKAWERPAPIVSLLSNLIDTSAIVTAICCAVAVVVLTTGVRVPPSLTLRSLGIVVIGGISLTVGASFGMHLVGAAGGHDAVRAQVLAATVISALLATWIVVRAYRCLRISAA